MYTYLKIGHHGIFLFLIKIILGFNDGEELIRNNTAYNHTLYQPFVPYEDQITSTGGSYNYSQYQPLSKVSKLLFFNFKLFAGSRDERFCHVPKVRF